jgi:hypothetical protein
MNGIRVIRNLIAQGLSTTHAAVSASDRYMPWNVATKPRPGTREVAL